VNAIHVSFDDDVVLSDVIPLNHVIDLAGPPLSDEDEVWRLRLRHVARTGKARQDRPGVTKTSKLLEWALFDLAYFLAVEDPDTCWLIELVHLCGVLQTATPYAAKHTMCVRYDVQDVYAFASKDDGANALKPMADEGWRLRAFAAYQRAERRPGDVVTVITHRKAGRKAVDMILGAGR